ncbi:MAG: hypothetical protein FWG12_02890 [Holophagaceae bacterium]|nr:hypothetical protein [Holophagaceae bacterium]
MRSLPSFAQILIGLCLGLGICPGVSAQAPQQQGPPEQAELVAARNISDVSARLKELKRIKEAYPQSTVSYTIDLAILATASLNTDSLDGLLAAQMEAIGSSKIQDRFWLLLDSTDVLLSHPKTSEFSMPEVLKAIQDNKVKALTILANPDNLTSVPQKFSYTIPASYKDMFEVSIARAQLQCGDGQAAIATLEKHGEHSRGTAYYFALGEAYLDQKRDNEALEAFLQVAAESNPAATEKAREIYVKLNGNEAGFEAEIEKLRETRPFSPPPFSAPENWKGKTVLAEVFTGSECPPCVSAGFGYDALKDYYSTQYLAVLKYHLPIPRYDPMMNPATQKRQDYYAVRSTPTAIIDGVKSVPAGGYRTASFDTFFRAKNEIDPLLSGTPLVTIRASATIDSDKVTVDCEFSNIVEGADYHVVLAQTEEEFKGYNGIKSHKMVVRDIETVPPGGSASVTFDLPESEKLADTHISDWGKTAPQTRITGSKWPQKNNKISRSNLKAVVFIQDRESKQVHNALVVDVKTR